VLVLSWLPLLSNTGKLHSSGSSCCVSNSNHIRIGELGYENNRLKNTSKFQGPSCSLCNMEFHKAESDTLNSTHGVEVGRVLGGLELGGPWKKNQQICFLKVLDHCSDMHNNCAQAGRNKTGLPPPRTCNNGSYSNSLLRGSV
jgi:hypothetical protein